MKALQCLDDSLTIGTEINMEETDIVEDAMAITLRYAMHNQNMDDWEQSWSDSDNEIRSMEDAD